MALIKKVILAATAIFLCTGALMFSKSVVRRAWAVKARVWPAAHVAAAPIQPNTGPVVFRLRGTVDEIKKSGGGGTIKPEVCPPDLKATVQIKGKGAVHFMNGAPGVWFTGNGQQNADSAYFEFLGPDTKKLFDLTGPGEVSLNLQSHYSLAQRTDLIRSTKNRQIMRTVLRAYNDTGTTVWIETGYNAGLYVMYGMGPGSPTFHYFPKGREDEYFGKDKLLKVRLVWDGVSKAQLFLNGVPDPPVAYRKGSATWKNAGFAIGARDRREYGGGFWACDDAISEVVVHNAGPLRDTQPPKLEITSAASQKTVSGARWLRVEAADNEEVSNVRLLADGKELSRAPSYPYLLYLDTRTMADGPHQLEFAATDNSSNVTRKTVAVTVQNAGGPDTEAPEPPAALGTAEIHSKAVTLQWRASGDNRGTARYLVSRNGAQVGEVAPQAGGQPLTYADSGLQPETTYTYQVAAVDAAGNRSDPSIPLQITTPQQDGKTLRVGPKQKYKTPCEAVKAAAAWDTIEIEAGGEYNGDVCVIDKDHLTLRGVNGRPHIDASGAAMWGMGVWVTNGADILVENVEISGCVVADRNGAAIRGRGRNLTLRNVYFHHNQDGVLATPPSSGILIIENSEFAENGANDAYSHNLYIEAVDRFEMRYSNSHNAVGGQLVKSRAKETRLLYNRLMDEKGSGNYEIDIPNAGLSWVIGNVMQKSLTATNHFFISYGMEGLDERHEKQLYIVNNTFVTDLDESWGLHAPEPVKVLLQNNLFTGKIVKFEGGKVEDVGNRTGVAKSVFLNAGAYDYRLKPSAGLAGAGKPVGKDLRGQSLAPVFEYMDVGQVRLRPAATAADPGAYAAKR